MTKDRLAALKAVSIESSHLTLLLFSSLLSAYTSSHFVLTISLFFLQAQSEDDDTGPDDVAVTVEAQDGYMEAFFAEVT